MIDQLLKYFKRAAGYPLLFSFIAGIILAVTHNGKAYQSEWFSDDGFVETICFTIALSLIISLLSASLFLNSANAIRLNAFYSFMAWMAPASSICLYVIYREVDNFMTGSEIYEGNRVLDGFILSMAIVHIACLAVTFVLYRRRVVKK